MNRLKCLVKYILRPALDFFCVCPLLFRGVDVGRNVMFRAQKGCSVSFGLNTSLGRNSIILCTREKSANHVESALVVGRNVAINEGAVIRACGGRIEIGDNSMLAQYSKLIASNHSIRRDEIIAQQLWESTRTGIKIGKDVWIGAGAVVLPGCTIGDGAVIAANAVVTKDIGSNEIYAGVPARLIGVRE